MPVKKRDLSGCRSSRTADISWFPFAVAAERVRVHSRSPRFRHQSQPITARPVFIPASAFLPQSQGTIRQATLTGLDVPDFELLIPISQRRMCWRVTSSVWSEFGGWGMIDELRSS
jgi:hypothetical protein